MNPIRRSSDLLPSPSRLCGLARTLDLWASVDPWPWHGSFALDARALYRDWEIIGADLVDASLRLRSATLVGGDALVFGGLYWLGRRRQNKERQRTHDESRPGIVSRA